jgi:hypothetical protein
MYTGARESPIIAGDGTQFCQISPHPYRSSSVFTSSFLLLTNLICRSHCSLAFAGLTQHWHLQVDFHLHYVTDSQLYVTDPEFQSVPIKELLSKVCYYALVFTCFNHAVFTGLLNFSSGPI